MGLPRVFQSQKKTAQKYLSILISDTTIQAALWEASSDQINALSQSSLKTYSDQEQAAAKTDEALQELGKASEEVDDVVFGFLPTWVDDQGIVAIRKPLLKNLTDELGLKAVGFIVTSEALAHHLTINNPRISALVIELSQQELFLTLLDQGKLLGTKYVGRSDDIIADMAEALARLNAHLETELHLPAKMLLTSLDLDSADLMEYQQLLIDHNWVNSHPFMQPPTVEILAGEEILKAVVIQGGAVVTGVKIKQQPNFASQSPTTSSTTTVSAASSQARHAVVKTKADSPPSTPPPSVSSFGVPVKMDQLSPNQLAEAASSKPELAVAADDRAIVEDAQSDSPPKIKSSQFRKLRMSISHWFRQHRKFALGGFTAGVLALVLVGWVWLATGVQAVVELKLITKPISQETNITLDSSQDSSDVEELILAAQTMEQSAAGSKTKETTGVKLVGDKAVGKVTLFNKTEAVKTFAAGVQLSQGNLVFTVDESVEVASASVEKSTSGGTEVTTKEFGQVEATVTAADIGADYNLGEETELQVASFDPGTYSAVIVETFTGGSSREVRVVSEEDQAELLADLKQELIDQATEEMESQLPDKTYLIPIDQATIEQQAFDAEVGDEVGTLKLDLSITAHALSYSTDDLRPLAEKILAADIPAHYTLENSEPQILSAPGQTASRSGTVNLLVNVSAEAKPDVSQDELKAMIVGKRLDEAEQTLAAQDVVESVEIQLVPGIANKIWSRVPQDAAKIEIK